MGIYTWNAYRVLEGIREDPSRRKPQMNATELTQRMCELLTAKKVFTIYTKYHQFMVVGSYSSFDISVGGLISTFDKSTTQVDIEDDRVMFTDGNSYFTVLASDVLAIDQ